MAEESMIQSMIPDVSGTQILDTVLWGLVIILIIGAIGLFLWYWYKKRKYKEYRIVIWEKDSTGNAHEYYDRGGIFIDKTTSHKLLFLEKMKKGLNPNNVPYVTSKDKKGRLVKTVYLRRTGVSNYVFCHIKINDDGTLFTVGEEDVNWAAQDIEKIRRTFNKESWLTKYAPYIIFIVTIMIVMIILLALFNKMGVIEEASSNMLLVSEKQERITELMLNITESNALNPGRPIIIPGGG